jgi:3-hydroxyisobutyrate dehydrogenase-like beta-hydroxyacid dehydrogenase
MNKPVGIPGPGIMSGTIARNLVDRSWYIIGFNIDPARQTGLAEAASRLPQNAEKARWP